jgi:iron complex outermembrane receptor protein
MFRKLIAAAACLGFFAASRARSQDSAKVQELAGLSIEQLMSIDVTSASRHDEPLFQAPTAIFVITQEDLRRSGVLSIPDALRMVPGLDVQQIDANKWEVAARGFNSRFSNKLLVLIDGRILYTHIFSGVYWDTKDVVLEDLDRIEVIRGPGATLWGANAVNGVINIITKSSRDTQGGLVVLGAGNLEKVFGVARYGGKVGEDLTYRLWAKGFSRANNDLPGGESGRDGWDSEKSGLRADWKKGSDSATLEGEVHKVRTGDRISALQSFAPPVTSLLDRDGDFYGGFGSLAWKHDFSALSSATFSASYDVRMRDEELLRPHEEILDLGFQDNFSLGRHEIVWGLGYRRSTDTIPGSFTVSFNPVHDKQSLVSGFLQDDVTLVNGRLRAIVGLKVESFDGHSPEYQPNLRFLWTPSARQTIWASAARALTAPGRAQLEVRYNVAAFTQPDGTPVLVSIFGDQDLRQESVVAYEAGYRIQATESVELDLAAFYNRYDRLITVEAGAPFLELSPGPPHLVIPQTLVNGGLGNTYGAELAAGWNATSTLRFRGAVTWLEMDLRFSNPSAGPVLESFGDGARLQASLRSSVDLPHHLQADLNLYYVGVNPGEGVDPSLRVDLLARWRPVTSFELAAGVLNLSDRRQLEVTSTTDGIQPTVMPLSAYGKITWRF